MEWKEIRLGDILNFRRGHDLPHSKMIAGKIPVAGSNGIIGYHNVATPVKPLLTIGRSGNIGTPYIYETAWAHNTTLYIDDFKGNHPLFLYYLCKILPFANFQAGSAVPTLNRNHIHQIIVKYPPNYTDQSRIASILSSLDSKIETNNKINAKLEEMAQALFKSWFVDFEPFKDKGMVESELGMIPEGWRVGNLLDIADLSDSKRKPLSSRQRAEMQGEYPYYGATSIMDYVNDYIFDGTYLLMGEDGSVMKDDGTPYLQYVWGKFWPNNHAHVMQGKNGYSTEMLHCLLSMTNVNHIVTGAVQLKISQQGMSRIQVVIPNQDDCMELDKNLQPIYKQIKALNEENLRLSLLRDTLLPKLMSGEIEL